MSVVDLFSRRGILKGFFSLSVVAVVPKAILAEAAPKADILDPFDVKAPPGMTYQWVRISVMGEKDPHAIIQRLENGWRFVAPSEQPVAPTADLGAVVEHGGLVLMEKPTERVEADQAARCQETLDMFGSFSERVGMPNGSPNEVTIFGFVNRTPTDEVATKDWVKKDEGTA